jgi:DNA-binding NarL/FixJ family response regulator
MLIWLPLCKQEGMNVMLIKNAKSVKSLSKSIETIKAAEISKSAKMKQLFELGLSVKEIAGHMECRYQFAYNVISNWVNTAGIEITVEERTSKKDIIVDLYNQGRTNKEISVELKVNYNYVFKVLKDHKASLVTNQEAVAE